MNQQTESHSTEQPKGQLVVGFDTGGLQGDQKRIERSAEFKKVLFDYCEEKLGPMEELPSIPLIEEGKAWRDSDDVARKKVSAFIAAGPANGELEIDRMKSLCRATRTGWIRERFFRVRVVDTDTSWNAEPVVRRYYAAHAPKDKIPDETLNAFRAMPIELVVVSHFTISNTY